MNMATEIGIIKTVIGTVVTKAADGSQRPLQAGDIIFQNETIITGDVGAIEIELSDGSLIDLGRNSETVLDPTLLQIKTSEQELTTESEVESLQQAILNNADPTQDAAPTAAGTNINNLGGNEGTTLVQVQHLAPKTTPTSGFDTTGVGFVPTEENEILGQDTPSISSEDMSNISLTPDNQTITTNEAGLAAASDAASNSETASGQLTSTGGTGIITYSLDSNAEGNNGTLTLNNNGSFSYTLTSHVASGAIQGSNTVNGVEKFEYTATDNNGNTTTGTISVNVIDDTPTLIINQDIVSDTTYSFTVTNHDEVSSAGYNSSYGYYVKDAQGNPTTGVVIWDNVKNTDADSITLPGQFTPDQIGFFIIPNGDRKNASLTDDTEVTFELINGEWTALNNGQPLKGSGSPVLFDNASLNRDGEDHVQDNSLTGNQNWEDLPIRSGDGDYNDVNVNVEWAAVTVSGNSIDSSTFDNNGNPKFGADGAGSLNFTLDNVTILGNLTSNGKDITFEAKDTDDDGYNDQIIGSTVDGQILSIDGVLDQNGYEISLFAPIKSTNNSSDDVKITANVEIKDGDGDIALATLNFNLDINQIIETVTSDLN